jgi:hypothetical protein
METALKEDPSPMMKEEELKITSKIKIFETDSELKEELLHYASKEASDDEGTNHDLASFSNVKKGSSDGDDIEFELLIGRWKEAIEEKDKRKVSEVYTDLLNVGSAISLDLMEKHNVGDLCKRSKKITRCETIKEVATMFAESCKKMRAAMKRKSKEVAGEGGEPMTKKLRIKHEKVLEVSDRMKTVLAKNYEVGLRSMPLDVLAMHLGYKNHRSDAIAESVKHLKKEGILTKTFKENTVQFTEKGITENVTETETPTDPGALLDMYWSQFEKAMANHKKGKGVKALEAARVVWDLLTDGEGHDMAEVLHKTGYAGENSSAIEAIKQCLKNLNLALKKGKELQFTEKVLSALQGHMD